MRHLVCSVAVAFLVGGCATPTQKQLIPTSGSRSDGIVKLSFDYGAREIPQIDLAQGKSAAKIRCLSWGYSDADAFGGGTKQCISSNSKGCTRMQVTYEYQCIGTGDPTEKTPRS
jgi:hypothetical protein